MTQQAAVLRRDDISEFISKMYEGDLHAKRVLSLSNATLGVLTSASLAIHAVGQGLAQAMGTLSKHGVKQVDRLLSNEGIDVERFFGYWVPYMVGARREIVVALDWTSFARDGHETIVLSMLTGHGRATPRIGDYAVMDWENAGLLGPSTVRARLTTLRSSHLLRKLGELSRRDMEGLSQWLRRVMEL